MTNKPDRKIHDALSDFLPQTAEIEEEKTPVKKQEKAESFQKRNKPQKKKAKEEVAQETSVEKTLTDKATFHLPVSSLDELEKSFLQLRMKKGRGITKSGIVALLLDEFLPLLLEEKTKRKIEDYADQRLSTS